MTVSPGLQQLVSTAIGQEPPPPPLHPNPPPQYPTTTPAPPSGGADILGDDDDVLNNLKVEDIEDTILSSDDPLPVIKNEEVEGIISDLIGDPEQHLNLDGSEDIITNLDNELQGLHEQEQAEQQAQAQAQQEASNKAHVGAEKVKLKEEPVREEKQPPPQPFPKSDPFEFEEEPEMTQIQKPSSSFSKLQDATTAAAGNSSAKQQHEFFSKDPPLPPPVEAPPPVAVPEEVGVKEKEAGSVEIVEVVVMDDDDIDRQLNKSQIQDIVHSHKPPVDLAPIKEEAVESPVIIDKEIKTEMISSESEDVPESSSADSKSKEASSDATEPAQSPGYPETVFDDLLMEVNKRDELVKGKRDYSRTNKPNKSKDVDILMAVEKIVAAGQSGEASDDTFSENDYGGGGGGAVAKKFDFRKDRLRSETDRSNSPWTEEDEMGTRNKRRYSTPATPSDSVPNSPASSNANADDDRDYRNWKKSIMLLYDRLVMHRYTAVFMRPIKSEDYCNAIYRPMDFQTVRKNVDAGAIRTTVEFERDLMLIFSNAAMFNRTNSSVHEMAGVMREDCMQQMEIFKEAQLDVPQKRETRTSEPANKRKRPPEENVRNKKRRED